MRAPITLAIGALLTFSALSSSAAEAEPIYLTCTGTLTKKGKDGGKDYDIRIINESAVLDLDREIFVPPRHAPITIRALTNAEVSFWDLDGSAFGTMDRLTGTVALTLFPSWDVIYVDCRRARG